MKIDLKCAAKILGTLEFSSDSRELTVTRTAEGLAFCFPAEANFPSFDEREPCGYLTDVRLTVFQYGVQVGAGADPGFHWGVGERKFKVSVAISAGVLAFIEEARNGRSLAFKFHVDAKTGVVQKGSSPGLLSMPNIISADIDVEFDRDRWIDLLRTTGWGESIITEISLPTAPTEPPWNEVWKTLRLARDALDRGGPAGWKACISECRGALEKWRDIEPLDTGGQVAANSLTRVQRFDVIRQSIHRYAHDPVHSDADLTTRAEAVMILGAVAGLLGTRMSR